MKFNRKDFLNDFKVVFDEDEEVRHMQNSYGMVGCLRRARNYLFDKDEGVGYIGSLGASWGFNENLGELIEAGCLSESDSEVIRLRKIHAKIVSRRDELRKKIAEDGCNRPWFYFCEKMAFRCYGGRRAVA